MNSSIKKQGSYSFFISFQIYLRHFLNSKVLSLTFFFHLYASSQYQVDAIIKIDTSYILRYDFLHYKIDELLREQAPSSDLLWLYIDPKGQRNILFENTKENQQNLIGKPEQFANREKWDKITEEQFKNLAFPPHQLFLNFFNESQLQSLSKQKVICIEQVRAKCQANVYFDPEDVLREIKMILAWNQVFRTRNRASFLYISGLYQKIVQLINKRKFHSKFYTKKLKDFEKILSNEITYKIEPKTWPFIPQNFRVYQELQRYCPTPEKRSEQVQKRIHTKKQPVKCPQNCVCLRQNDNSFCSYTLKDGWISECPNRANKIECNHSDFEQAEKCKNSEIRKQKRKKCKKNQLQPDHGQQIQECIIWGIDYFTRNLIFHSLPQFDIDLIQSINNKDEKNKFIQESLLKAINFNGKQGYNFEKACDLIINSTKQNPCNQSGVDNINGNMKSNQNIWRNTLGKQKILRVQMQQGEIFNQKDRYYAEILLKNYKFCINYIDKTAFRIHTKGKGARCINKQGIKHGSFIVEYFGELYEPWRWYQREDFIKEFLKKKKLKNFIPQFYNIYLQTHRDDPDGYDLMVVDPVKKGNFSSRFSHSCNPNCGTVATISNGKYYIAMYAFRDIKYGQQLTFDYCCMTQSSYEHRNSICLCGMQKCRGNYLQLSNTPAFSQLVDKNTCFHSRNSLILGALEQFTQEDLKLCQNHNIKDKMLQNSPKWIKKWMAKLLRFIQVETQMYKQQLKQKWTKNYPWGTDQQEVRKQKVELYSDISTKQLLEIRFQNLFTTVDKLKYFLNSIQDQNAPLIYIDEDDLVQILISQPKFGVFSEIQDILIEQKRQAEAKLVEQFIQYIQMSELIKIKLFYFRLGCLCLSHFISKIPPTSKFNTTLLSDIIYFYAFTHTYFKAHQYKSHVSDEIIVCLQQVTGNPKDFRTSDKIKRRYSSQFVWGQLVSWYKQTIVSPQSSLSQDRRGTLSYPTLKSTVNSVYPFERHCRKNFIKAIREKPSSCWPSAPHDGCVLSFKNPLKCYGTIFFENIHNAQKLKNLAGGNLLYSCLDVLSSPFQKKLQLFKQVEQILSGIGRIDSSYDVLDFIQSKYFNFSEPLPQHILQSLEKQEQKSRKKRKVEKDNDSR